MDRMKINFFWRITFLWGKNDRVGEVGSRINGTAVFVRGRVGYLPDLSFCPGPLLKPLNKLLRIFAPADVQ